MTSKNDQPNPPPANPLNIYQRIHAVMQKVDYIQKTKPKDGGIKYSTVSHDAVTAAIRPHLVEQNVVYFPQNLQYKQDGNRTEVTLDIHFVCIDNPQDRLSVPSLGCGIDQQDKGSGKAVSYAVKYALLKTFGLETGDDPDNESIDHKPDPKPQAAKPPTPQAVKAADLLTEQHITFLTGQIKVCTELTAFQGLRDRASRDKPRMTESQQTRVAAAIAERKKTLGVA